MSPSITVRGFGSKQTLGKEPVLDRIPATPGFAFQRSRTGGLLSIAAIGGDFRRRSGSWRAVLLGGGVFLARLHAGALSRTGMMAFFGWTIMFHKVSLGYWDGRMPERGLAGVALPRGPSSI